MTYPQRHSRHRGSKQNKRQRELLNNPLQDSRRNNNNITLFLIALSIIILPYSFYSISPMMATPIQLLPTYPHRVYSTSEMHRRKQIGRGRPPCLPFILTT